MSEYVRQTAWLNAAPDPPKSRGEKSPRPVSRRNALEGMGITPEMPTVEWGQYLLDWLFEFGPTMAAGMGDGPLTATEIISWERILGIEFQPWEARLLRRLSLEYACESSVAGNPDRPAPFGESSDAAMLRQAELQRELDIFLN